MFDYHIVEHVIELWGRDQESAGLHLSFNVVKNIMETVFLTGLKREEDRPVQVSVTLAPPAAFPSEARVGENVVLSLEKHLPFTVDSLVKLAPAFDPITTGVAVCPSEEDPSLLNIWGAVFSTRRGRNRFDALPFTVTAPDLLTISSSKTGSLSIFRGENIIARFNAGKFTEPTPTPFTSSLMGWNLLKVVRGHRGFKRFGARYWNIYRDVIDRLLVESTKVGHGGTIVWLPEEELNNANNWILPKYSMKNGPEGSSLLDHLCALDIKREERLSQLDESCHENVAQSRAVEEGILECKRHIVEHTEILANLTSVDGALIITDKLQPLSFSSILIAPLWYGETIYGPNDEAHNMGQVNLTRYGTRHNSAVNFVGSCPGSVTFVISQDGPIAGLTRKDEETVYWWPDCLSRLWAS